MLQRFFEVYRNPDASATKALEDIVPKEVSLFFGERSLALETAIDWNVVRMSSSWYALASSYHGVSIRCDQ
jgi:hypothetical protein